MQPLPFVIFFSSTTRGLGKEGRSYIEDHWQPMYSLSLSLSLFCFFFLFPLFLSFLFFLFFFFFFHFFIFHFFIFFTFFHRRRGMVVIRQQKDTVPHAAIRQRSWMPGCRCEASPDKYDAAATGLIIAFKFFAQRPIWYGSLLHWSVIPTGRAPAAHRLSTTHKPSTARPPMHSGHFNAVETGPHEKNTPHYQCTLSLAVKSTLFIRKSLYR